MFTRAYRTVFAAVGRPLKDSHGCPVTEIAQAEKRLELKVPRSLMEFYRAAGREKQVNQCFDRLLVPKGWDVEKQRLVFMEENQNVVVWGIPISNTRTDDAAVFQGSFDDDGELRWVKHHASCAEFLQVMVAWQSAFGGAAQQCAVGYFEKSPRKLLDADWTVIGEAGGVRAYRRPGAVTCLTKAPDNPLREAMGLPKWTLYAGTSSLAGLKGLQEVLPGQWDPSVT